MAQQTFFRQPPRLTLADIAALTKAHLVDASRAGQSVQGLASLDEAGPMHLAFFDNLKYVEQLACTHAGACLVHERFEGRVPSHVAVLRSAQPFRAFVELARHLHHEAQVAHHQQVGRAGIAPVAVEPRELLLLGGCQQRVPVDLRQVGRHVAHGVLQGRGKRTSSSMPNVSASGRPITLEALPSIDRTSIPPRPWIP